jgi:hypothetical protein
VARLAIVGRRNIVRSGKLRLSAVHATRSNLRDRERQMKDLEI